MTRGRRKSWRCCGKSRSTSPAPPPRGRFWSCARAWVSHGFNVLPVAVGATVASEPASHPFNGEPLDTPESSRLPLAVYAEWCAMYPNHNALILPSSAGFVVFVVAPNLLEWAVVSLGPTPFRVCAPDGATQLWYRGDAETSRVMPGIEVFGRGGGVLAPGSLG